MNLAQMIKAIRSNLSDKVREKFFRGDPNPETGCCYVASEALYHLTGRKLQPMRIEVRHPKYGCVGHWYLQDTSNGTVHDITASQFPFPLDYSQGHKRAFLTKEPCKRTKTLLEAIQDAI